MSSVARVHKIIELPRTAPAFVQTLNMFEMTVTQYSMLCSSQTEGYMKFGCHANSINSPEQVEALHALRDKHLVKLDGQIWKATIAGQGIFSVIGDLVRIPPEKREGKLLTWKK